MKKLLSFVLVLAMVALTACQKQPQQSETTTIAGVTPETTTTEESAANPTTPEETTTKVPAVVTPQKGVVQVFEQDSATADTNKQLWDSREFTTRQMENIGRGLVAVKNDMGVFVSWRWLGDESAAVRYNLYRDGKRVNALPLNVTNFTDTSGKADSTYQVAAVIDGVEQEKCEAVTVWADGCFTIELNDPPIPYYDNGTYKKTATYSPNDMSIADLDGDGEYEFILKWDPADSKDNSQEGATAAVILDAYKLDGTRLWRINLGPNIRAGAHYTQFMVYDLDGDGKAELVCKTADGTIDGAGTVIGEQGKIWRNGSGYILDGPEYLTVFNGETGVAMDTVEYEVARGNVSAWGDSYGNRVDRFLACVAYLNGSTPSVVMCRGYYTRATLVAYNLVDGKLQKVWTFDSDVDGSAAAGQGNHSVTVADVDMDGKDEIVYGSAVIDDNGKLLYSTGLGHGDAQHTGDLIPSRPGLEIFSVHENASADFGFEMRDARTGDILWGSYENSDVGRGVSADIDPNYPGNESWAAGKLVASDGSVISTNFSISTNFRIYWDGDLGEEVQDGNHIDKWVSDKKMTTLLMTNKDYVSCNGTKSTPGLTCDLIGDWREETILFSADGTKMTIFTTTIPTDYKIYTLMHDLQYRTYVTTQNVAYNQPAHTGYYLGFDTTEIPVPRIQWTENGQTVVNPDLANGVKYYPIDTLMRDESVAMKIGVLNAMVNDYMQRVDLQGNTIAPYLSNGVAYVPLTFIEEAFGVTTDYRNGMLKIDGKAVTLTDAAQTVNDVVCVPVTVVEALGKKVAMYNDTLVYISNTDVTLDSDAQKILISTLDNYVEPASVAAQLPVSFESLKDKSIPVKEATASTDEGGNVAAGAVDGDLETRWNGWDDGATLTADLGETFDVAAVAATFFKGNERNYYFDIEVSVDGENWTKVLENQASPITLDKEFSMFVFPETVKARYVRYVGHNSSSNNANNIWEFVILKP